MAAIPSLQRFSTVSSIRVEEPETWDGRIFLTFDIDWAHDGVIAHTIDIVEAAGVPVTWFATHDTPLLDRIRKLPGSELGIHPNFLPLLMQGDAKAGKGAEDVVDRMLDYVPEAKSVRSHSLVQSGRLLEIFRRKGLTHDCNMFIPEQSLVALRPWVDWFGMIRVPYDWEDDFWCDSGSATTIGQLLDRPGLHGFDFHPIHVFLNTESLARYEAARPHFGDPERLVGQRFAGRGAATMLHDLLDPRCVPQE